MVQAHQFLQSLTIVLVVAAVTTVVFQWLRQPVVLGYLIAGLIVGPHLPIPLVADPDIVQTLSEFGVILLMFSIGLELSVRKLVAVGPVAGLTALLETSVMVWAGFTTAQLFGWSTLQSLFTGGIVAISSTTIIAKVFAERGVTGKSRELVFGILVVEDLIAVLLMTIFTALASGSGLAAGPLVATVARLLAFLVAMIVGGLLVVPRAVRAIARLRRRETLLVASIGICFGLALLAHALGYSVALGAFLAGSLVAESGEERAVAHLVEPVRDMFAAVFFVSVGMLIDPALVARHWPAVLALTGVVIVGKIVGVSVGAFLTGNGLRSSIQTGMSLSQIGEFSFIIAGLGVALHATDSFLYPVAITVSAVTTLVTPWLIHAAEPFASWMDRRLPRPLQTFAALYGSWLEALRSTPKRPTTAGEIRRVLRLLLLDAAVLAFLIVGTAGSLATLTRLAEQRLGLSAVVARSAIVAVAVVLAAPFCVGVVRSSRRLGMTLARVALPKERRRRVDFAAAPRRTLVATLQLAGVLLVGAPLLALTQPFLPLLASVVLFALVLAGLWIGFWRSATNLQGHVRAGAQVVLDALTAQTRHAPEPAVGRTFADVHEFLPGLGALAAVALEPASTSVGKTLAQLKLRGRTGATVLALTRAGGGVIVPTANERLQAGDVLALAGTHEAIAAATAMLDGRNEAPTGA
ncbi:MAG TPA: cation:proton antiporter [Gemmatimonadales bacterium]|nr:cation:proton antiporter [Gemmatimonadales bacterium]